MSAGRQSVCGFAGSSQCD